MRKPPRDVLLLFSTRILRLFCYGFLSVVLALYLIAGGLTGAQTGLIFTLTLAGDAGISLWLTSHADRLGRRKTLLAGALLMLGAGLVFISTFNPALLIAAAILGVLSPSGGEIGPFLSVEQASLTQLISDRARTETFAWYNLAGSFATATGALAGGFLSEYLQAQGFSAVESYRVLLAGYSLGGALLFTLFLNLSPLIEAAVGRQDSGSMTSLGLHRSRPRVLRLSALFALDAFAGGLILQSMLAYWLHLKFGLAEAQLGSIYFGANILAGISALSAASLARRFGLINTMVFTHLPSNLLLMLIPFMPSPQLAIILLFIRFSISQMDVPTRQSYTMAVVDPDERSAASGVTTIARSVGAALSPALSGALMGIPALFNLPLLLAGGLKIIYDLSLFRAFRAIRPPEEDASVGQGRIRPGHEG